MYAKTSNPTGTSTKSAATMLKMLKDPPLYSLLQQIKNLIICQSMSLRTQSKAHERDVILTRPNFPCTNLSGLFRYSHVDSRTVVDLFPQKLSSVAPPSHPSQAPEAETTG